MARRLWRPHLPLPTLKRELDVVAALQEVEGLLGVIEPEAVSDDSREGEAR